MAVKDAASHLPSRETQCANYNLRATVRIHTRNKIQSVIDTFIRLFQLSLGFPMGSYGLLHCGTYSDWYSPVKNLHAESSAFKIAKELTLVANRTVLSEDSSLANCKLQCRFHTNHHL